MHARSSSSSQITSLTCVRYGINVYDDVAGEPVRELGEAGGGGPRGRLPPGRRIRRRRRGGQPQQEPRLVDAEQLGVPQRAAAGGALRHGAALHVARIATGNA